MPDINGVWHTWCDIITNETVTLQEAAMLKVASEDFHIAWNGIKAKANMLDLAGWMRATAARNSHIRAWQLFFEEYPVVLAPTTVKPTPGPREDAISGERAQEIFWNDLRFISAINVLGLPAAVVPVALHQGKPIGVQLITGRYREDLALDAAAAIEKRAGMLVRQLWDRMGLNACPTSDPGSSSPDSMAKKLCGISVKPNQWVGITGQSSIRVMWWKPTVYQATMSRFEIARSRAVQAPSVSLPSLAMA